MSGVCWFESHSPAEQTAAVYTEWVPYEGHMMFTMKNEDRDDDDDDDSSSSWSSFCLSSQCRSFLSPELTSSPVCCNKHGDTTCDDNL